MNEYAQCWWRNKQLFSKSTPYAGGTNSCFLNQPLRWWYTPTLEVQPYAGGTDAADPYSNWKQRP